MLSASIQILGLAWQNYLKEGDHHTGDDLQGVGVVKIEPYRPKLTMDTFIGSSCWNLGSRLFVRWFHCFRSANGFAGSPSGAELRLSLH